MQYHYFPIRSIEVHPLVPIGFYQLGKLESLDLLNPIQVLSMLRLLIQLLRDNLQAGP